VIASPENVFSYDVTTGTTQQLTNLPNDDQNAWAVQEAHVLPDGSGIIFFGAHYLQDGQPALGASGNGQQWWWIPVEGGEPQPWTEPDGSGVQAFAHSPMGDRLAYAYTAHSSACVSIQSLNVVSAGRTPGTPVSPTSPELEPREDGAAYFRGLSWSPDGARLAFGIQSYTCPEVGSEQLWGPSSIYVWQVGASAPRKLADGSFPTWVR
jgi:Tol biopolymer transport system component